MAKKDVAAVVSGMGLAMSIVTALMEKAKKAGLPDEAIHRLATPEGDALLDKFVNILAEATGVFKNDKTKDGWKLLEDVPFNGKSFTPDIVEFLKSGESNVNGDVIKQRAKELNANLGQRHAEWLEDHQELIPEEVRGKFLIFPGTIWRRNYSDNQMLRPGWNVSDRNAPCLKRLVPCLYWGSGGWCLGFRTIMENRWGSGARLVGSRG